MVVVAAVAAEDSALVLYLQAQMAQIRLSIGRAEVPAAPPVRIVGAATEDSDLAVGTRVAIAAEGEDHLAATEGQPLHASSYDCRRDYGEVPSECSQAQDRLQVIDGMLGHAKPNHSSRLYRN